MAELLVFDIHTQYAANIMTNHDQLVERQRRMAHLSGLSSALLTLISGAVMMGILFVGVKLVGYKEITGEILTLVTLAVMAAFEAVWSLPAAFQYLNHTFTSAKRLLEIAATPPSVTFALCTAAPSKGFDLSLKQVFYKYSSTDPWVLENFSLSIPAGMHMAICGPSGAGKSTFAYLLMRFIDPQKGEILLGGENIRNFSESDLRNKLILITQKAHIFNGTIRTNLLLANPDANEEELWRALSAACLDVFVSELPEALDTWVGEGGRQLSGGQMQRLSLARAFLRDAPIWILDEPTEGLDRKTESALMDSLLKIAEKRTLIVVTHRRAVMRYFEHIVHIGP
jgi:ATP-binding cassette subfamily C protein CydC